jgi:hypothetical protein
LPEIGVVTGKTLEIDLKLPKVLPRWLKIPSINMLGPGKYWVVVGENEI